MEQLAICNHLRLPLPSEQTTLNPFKAAEDVVRIYQLHAQCATLSNRSFIGSPAQIFEDITRYGYLGNYDLAIVVAMTITWTLLRYSLTLVVYQPFMKAWKMPANNSIKFSESAFKSLAYSVLWISAVYATFFRNHDFAFRPLEMFSVGSVPGVFGVSAEVADLRFVYGLEFSFYLHSIYATLFMDHWRRDSIAMLLHHALTLLLIGISYSFGYLKIGLLIFLCDDICDVLLEAGKVLSYLRVPGAKFEKFWDNLATASAIGFVVSWMIFRLLFHLTLIVRSSAIGCYVSQPVLPPPCFGLLSAFLCILYVFYWYWFYFIFKFVCRRLFRGELDDTRDDDDHDQPETDQKNGHCNSDSNNRNKKMD